MAKIHKFLDNNSSPYVGKSYFPPEGRLYLWMNPDESEIQSEKHTPIILLSSEDKISYSSQTAVVLHDHTTRRGKQYREGDIVITRPGVCNRMHRNKHQDTYWVGEGEIYLVSEESIVGRFTDDGWEASDQYCYGEVVMEPTHWLELERVDRMRVKITMESLVARFHTFVSMAGGMNASYPAYNWEKIQEGDILLSDPINHKPMTIDGEDWIQVSANLVWGIERPGLEYPIMLGDYMLVEKPEVIERKIGSLYVPVMVGDLNPGRIVALSSEDFEYRVGDYVPISPKGHQSVVWNNKTYYIVRAMSMYGVVFTEEYATRFNANHATDGTPVPNSLTEYR